MQLTYIARPPGSSLLSLRKPKETYTAQPWFFSVWLNVDVRNGKIPDFLTNVYHVDVINKE